MDDMTFAIYDKLGGQLKNYVDNYISAKEHGHETGYEISQDMYWKEASSLF